MINITGLLDRRILLNRVVKNNNCIINKNYSVRSWFEIYLENLMNIVISSEYISKIIGNFSESIMTL